MKVYCENTKDILEHEYDLLDGKLVRSNNWSEKFQGKVAGSIEDTGNGALIKIGKNTISLDYSEARELYIIMAAWNTDKIEFREEKVIKSL